MAKTTEINFGIKNVKYALKNDTTGLYGTVKDLAYVDSLSLDPAFSTTPIYGDGKLLVSIPSDQGYTGTLTFVQLSEEYEIDLGRKLKITGGTADVEQLGSRSHAVYYETNALLDGVNTTIKVWLLNVTTGKPTIKQNQSNPNPAPNNVEYDITIQGEYLTTDGDQKYVDVSGNNLLIFEIVSRPTDAGYDTFGTAVPTPTVLSE
jgi:phi13 family phage major tail protein